MVRAKTAQNEKAELWDTVPDTIFKVECYLKLLDTEVSFQRTTNSKVLPSPGGVSKVS